MDQTVSDRITLTFFPPFPTTLPTHTLAHTRTHTLADRVGVGLDAPNRAIPTRTLSSFALHPSLPSSAVRCPGFPPPHCLINLSPSRSVIFFWHRATV